MPYRRAPNVAPESTTETYVALKLVIDNWRWAGVPFYLRTGKALAARRSEIVIQFKQAPFALFRDTPVERLTPNDLILHIQPEEGMTLRFGAKIPGPSVQMDGVEMKFNYKDYFKAAPSTGYETLIYDCMIGDATLFQRADNIEAGWRVVQPVLDAWAEDGARRAADLSGRQRGTQRGGRAVGARRPALALHRRRRRRKIVMTPARPISADENLGPRLGCRRHAGDRRQGFDRARQRRRWPSSARAGSLSRSSAAGRRAACAC